MKTANRDRFLSCIMLAAVGVCASANAQDSGVNDQMHRHHDTVLGMQRALIAGSLDGTKAAAQSLLDDDNTLAAEGWNTYLDAVNVAAGTVVGADTLEVAAAGVANLGVACGDCHIANGVEIQFDDVDRPSNKEKQKHHMARHQWAADRMWEGLIGPSAGSWSRGANLLFESPIKTASLGDASEQDAIKQMSRRVHQLAANATTESDPAGRAGIYGEFLANCAACHNAVDKGPKD